ncbi:hypothetical protein J5837_06025 [Pseudoxanthomonas helianthi]|uniref:Uncharacterized protein n=1 Tax=Pseudoxanthomonas helianthi TaxID=1453541 RepID=A0A940X267_9GAMM|nr:hypothetical protein [Pseudoxanthomonas helianthi]MBP3983982.1 hypothetical protein [Pseudoxanthomonas helianthi]
MQQPASFWALVRSLSEGLGYTQRAPRGEPKGAGPLKTHTAKDMAHELTRQGLDPRLVLLDDKPTELGKQLEQYFIYRAQVLNDLVKPNLMDVAEAKALFDKVYARVNPPATCPIPNNKQSDEKRAPAYLTGLVNMLIYEAIGDARCNYSPSQLTTFTRQGVPLRTLARRVDGAFPSVVNPVAVWEIKEYYYTTTFGSRVADGVYETLLDGLELDELHKKEGVRAEHVLIVDARYTWWVCGKSYLCRMIDMLNMGLVSEIIFGREVEERIPVLAREWLARAAR